VRSVFVLAGRCVIAVAVTTATVQLWGMALQDDVPLPAPVFSLPATDAAVAAATPRRRGRPAQPAVVISAGLIASANVSPPPAPPAHPVRSPRPSAPPPPPAAAPTSNARPPARPTLHRPPRISPPAPTSVAPTSSPEIVPLPASASPPDLHAAPRLPITEPSTPNTELGTTEVDAGDDEEAEAEDDDEATRED